MHPTNVNRSNSGFPMTWSSTAVQELFDKNFSSNSTPATQPTAKPTAPSSASNSDYDKHKHNVIIGAVLGVAIAIILLVSVLLIRRRTERRRAQETVDDSRVSPAIEPRPIHVKSELPVSQPLNELSDPRPWLEMPATEAPAELAAGQRR